MIQASLPFLNTFSVNLKNFFLNFIYVVIYYPFRTIWEVLYDEYQTHSHAILLWDMSAFRQMIYQPIVTFFLLSEILMSLLCYSIHHG